MPDSCGSPSLQAERCCLTGVKRVLQALEANGVHLTRAAPAAAAPAGSKAKQQRGRAAASSVDPRVRQQLWKLARPAPSARKSAGSGQVLMPGGSAAGGVAAQQEAPQLRGGAAGSEGADGTLQPGTA